MKDASSSLRTGWITVWIALGLLGLLLFVFMTFSITQKSQAEFARYNACAQGRERVHCDPSLVWVMNGWSLVQATSTVMAPSDSTPNPGAAHPASSTVITYTASSTSNVSLVKAYLLNAQDATSQDVLRVSAGKAMTAKLTLTNQDKTTVSSELQLNVMPDNRTTNYKKSLTRSGADYSASYNIPANWAPTGTDTAVGATLRLTIKNAKGQVLETLEKDIEITK